MLSSLFGRRRPFDAPQALAQAVALHTQGRLDEAEARYRGILAAQPAHFDALHLLGVVRLQQGRVADAIDLIERALSVQPDAAAARANLGHALQAAARHADALAAFERALAADARNAGAHNGRAIALASLARHADALAAFEQALSLAPALVDAWINRGNVRVALGRPGEALADYDRALELAPESAPAAYNRGVALMGLRRLDEAVADFDRALAYDPGYADALYNRGVALGKLGQLPAALASFEAALARDPSYPYLQGCVADMRTKLGAWDGLDAVVRGIRDAVAAGRVACDPFVFMALVDDPAGQRACAALHAARVAPAAPLPRRTRAAPAGDRIRVAYVSGDLREHPVAHLMARLFERHDRTRFEVVAFALGPAVDSPMRARLAAAFDRFVDAGALADAEIAQRMQDLDVDIAVDLMGHTLDARPGIFARRPAPVQVNYLGYPGTTGAAYVDYILADRFVIPEAARAAYAEEVVWLPDTFQANDGSRLDVGPAPDRAALGLPAAGFVYCCFNNGYKIAAPVFAVWMRLLRDTPGSVLWLVAGGDALADNLRREAAAHDVDPDRLRFAPRVPYAAYLARYRAADLFLDTLPFNGGTTASDALAAGLPVVTCAGHAFAARMAGSVLTAVGLPELVTHDLAAYEGLARALAHDPDRLARLRATLWARRATAPLFDGERFRRHLEAAYVTMVQRSRRGEPPRGFAVPPLAG